MTESTINKKANCKACQTLMSSALSKHCREYHTNFIVTMVLEEYPYVATDEGFHCKFSCQQIFKSRSSVMNHLGEQTACKVPEYKKISSAKNGDTPSFPALKDISNVTRTLATHDEAVLSHFQKPKDPEEVEKRMLGLADCFDLVPYGIYNDTDGEETSLTSSDKLEKIITKFNGKTVHFSRKRKDIEVVDEETPVPKRKMRQISSNQVFSTTVLNGPCAKVLATREYFEMNDGISELLNTCWLSTPQIKYFSCKALAGAILYNTETTQALLITTIELYGRTSTIDPHNERSDVSHPPAHTRYKKLWPTTVNTSDGVKLLIGTDQSNYLVTGSIRVDKVTAAEAGPSTTNFTLYTQEDSRSTLIFLDKKVYEEAKQLGEDADCEGTDVSHSIYQLRQLRSKFNEIETYHRLRSTFDLFNIVKDQPISIFTLCDHTKAPRLNDSEDPANYTLGSKLFMRIATEVVSRKYKAKLTKDVVEAIMMQFKRNSQKIPKIIEAILDLFEDDSDQLRILYNNDLNRKLVDLAGLLASQITKANEDVIKNIETTMTKTQ